MMNDIHPVKTTGHGDYERRDIAVSGVVYFLVGLAVVAAILHFIVAGLYKVLENRFEAKQTTLSPLVTSAAKDTRKLPPEYKSDSDSADYEKYLQKSFPEPQLETNERTELNKIRLREEDILSTYDYVDKSAGTVRIPIDRAMDLLAQRGLPVREPPSDSTVVPSAKGKAKEAKKK